MTANHRFVILIVAAILALPEAAMPCSIPYMDYRGFVSEGLLPANVNGALFVWSITGYPVVIGGRRDGNVYLITVMPRLSPDSFRIVDKTRGKVVPARLQSADSSANGPTSSVYYLATDPTLKRCVQQPMGYEKSCFELRNPSRLIAQGRLVNVSARVNAHQGRFWITPKHGFIPGHVYELEYRSQAARAVWRYPHSTEVSISRTRLEPRSAGQPVLIQQTHLDLDSAWHTNVFMRLPPAWQPFLKSLDMDMRLEPAMRNTAPNDCYMAPTISELRLPARNVTADGLCHTLTGTVRFKELGMEVQTPPIRVCPKRHR